jgi:ATP-dependent helicase/nuclease subunit B
MPLSLITGPANSGKARAVLDEVRAQAARGREPLLVLPTRADVEHYRRELAEGGTVFGVRLERFAGLIAEIAQRVGMTGRPLGAVAREHVAAAVTRQVQLGELAQASRTPGFARALSTLGAELGAQRVSPARLRGALRVWAQTESPSGSVRSGYADDLSALYEAYRRALDRVGRPDPQLYAGRALDALRASPARWHATPVLFYGFDDLTPLELDAIETLAAVVDAPVTVSLAYEPGRMAFSGRATTFQTLAPGAGTHRALAARAEYYEPPARDALHHLERSLFEPDASAADPGPGVRLLEGGGERAELELVAGEIRALLDGGMPASEIAVVVRSPAGVAPLLNEIFDAYEIPHALSRRVGFAETALGRGSLALLSAAALDGSAEDLLTWLRTPGLLERPELADRLEAGLRAGGVDRAGAARTLWERQHWPLDALDRVAAAARRGPGALVARMSDELERLFAAPFRRRAALLDADERDDARALAAGRRALEELRELSAGSPSLAPDAAALHAALEGLVLVGEELPGAGEVVVVDPLALRARRVRALFLCRMQEGEFPAPATPEPFLADEERRRLAQASGLRLPRRDDTLGTERYLLYATVSRPQELLVISWHVADDDGAPAIPSLFVDDVCDLFAPALREHRRRRPLGAVGWSGPGRPAARAATQLAALAGPRRASAPIAPLADARVLRELRETAVWSASGLELWAGCPVRWFVERRLRADALEPDPEPMTRGGIAHEVLEHTLLALREQTGSARLDPGRLTLAKRLMHEALERALAEQPLSVAPERRPGARRRLEADLERYLEHAARADSPLEPRHLELAFGFGDTGHPALDLGDGVRVRGRIDRIDVGRGDEAVVYDYKGRRVPEPNHWVRDASYQIALYMRAAEQLLGLRAVGGFYQPLGNRDTRARGVLDADGAVELECVNGDRRDHGEFESLLDDTVAAAREAAAQARSGALEPRPDSCAWGGGCAYPTICRCER